MKKKKKQRKIKKSKFCSFLSKQHLILKIIFILLSFIFIFIANKSHFIALFFTTILLLGVCFKIYIIWLKIIVRLIPLFISLYLFVIILSVDFWIETILIGKITYLALLSAYLIQTTFMNSVAKDLHIFMKYRFFRKMFFFIIMTISFIPILLDKFLEFGKGRSIESCLESALMDSKNIYESIKNNIDNERNYVQKYNFWTFSNLYLMFYVVIIFLLAVN